MLAWSHNGRTRLRDESRRPPTFAVPQRHAYLYPSSAGSSSRILYCRSRLGPRAEIRRSTVSQKRHGHEPVLVEAVLRLLDPRSGQVVLDGTVGLGGHALHIIPRILPDGRYIGLDLDEAILSAARERLADLDANVDLVHGNYADFPDALERLGVRGVDQMLLDLGLNSAQLDDAGRGFSFDRDGPLDMRFDRGQKRQAIDLVNGLSERELADLFYEFGQEGASRRIARRICEARKSGRIRTTRVLARAVEAALTSAGGVSRGKTNPATRVFQALRVATNHELENLKRFLEHVAARLNPGGRLAVISFHSLEDGIVKCFLREARTAGVLRELTKRPVVADARERGANVRSRSAKLRVAERTEV